MKKLKIFESHDEQVNLDWVKSDNKELFKPNIGGFDIISCSVDENHASISAFGITMKKDKGTKENVSDALETLFEYSYSNKTKKEDFVKACESNGFSK